MSHDVTTRVHKNSLTEDERKRTIWILYKPYHWELDGDHLVLKSDWSEHERLRVDVMNTLLAKGMPENLITKAVIEEVIERAEQYMIGEQSEGSETEAGAG